MIRNQTMRWWLGAVAIIIGAALVINSAVASLGVTAARAGSWLPAVAVVVFVALVWFGRPRA